MMLKKARASLDSAKFYYQQQEICLLVKMSIVFYYLSIMQFVESSASGQLIHSGHDLLLSPHKHYCIILSFIF